MSAAYKYAAMQTFCIPTGEDDVERGTRQVRATTIVDEAPVQGWDQWIADISDMIRGCETSDALTRVQQTYRRELRQLASADKAKFSLVGTSFQEKRDELSPLVRNSNAAAALPEAPKDRRSRPRLSLRDDGNKAMADAAS
jgi:hypothetical protein